MALNGSDIVVAGGGIGGLTAALLLAEAGASVTLLERVAAPAAVGAGILLQPNGLAVLAGLGLDGELERRGRRLDGMSLRDGKGAMIADADLPDFGAGLDHLLALRRSDLHEVLLAAVADRRAIATRFGAEVLGASPDGTIELRWRDRVSTIAADVVIGADGIGSAVRSGGDFGAVVRPVGARYLRGLVPGRDTNEPAEHWTRLGLFGHAQVATDTVYFYAAATAPPVAAAMAARDLDQLRAVWANVLPASVGLLAAVPDFDALLVNDVARVDCTRWHDGRLALLGDAAHAMAPTLGQGANSAIVDAAVLAIELASHEHPLALARYDARRREPVRRVQDRADRLAGLSSVANPLIGVARNAALRLLTAAPSLAERGARMVQQEDPAALRTQVSALVRHPSEAPRNSTSGRTDAATPPSDRG